MQKTDLTDYKKGQMINFEASIDPIDEQNFEKKEITAIVITNGPTHNGHIVDVDGLSLERHTDKTPIPIKVEHSKLTGNMMPPIVGSATKFWTEEMSGVKVLKMAWKWEKEDSDLTQAWKYFVEKGLVRDMSIGAHPIEAEAMRDKAGNMTGVHIKKAILHEVSLTYMGEHPAAQIQFNQNVNLLKLEEKLNIIESRLDEIVSCFYTLNENKDKNEEFIKNLQNFVKDIRQ